jgi:hypothetical protein
MAVYTEELNTNFNYPHIDIFNRLRDGELTGYQARTHEGYVMYDTTANNTEQDPDTFEEIPVTYYYILRGFPKTYNFDNFPWVAVPRDSVNENYIFGGGNDNDHEVM